MSVRCGQPKFAGRLPKLSLGIVPLKMLHCKPWQVVLYKHPDHLVVWEALDRNESHLEETAKNIAPYATPENRAAAQDSTRQNDASGTSVSVVQAKHADTAVAPTSFSNSFILELD